MAKILILIGAHLCTAPRPQKEADVLTEIGHHVTIRGVWFNEDLASRDQSITKRKSWKFEPALDFRHQRRLTNWQVRFKTRLARELYQRLGLISPYLLGYGAFALLQVARKATADLTIVHSEAGLWVGSRLLDEGFRVGVDFEDWFSEDLPLKARAARPIAYLKSLESKLLKNCEYCLTTSHAMAKAMSQTTGFVPPSVIYNAFPWAEREYIDDQTKDRKNHNLRSIHWFSQTVGPERGLEILMVALTYLADPVEVHLRGNYPESARQWLEPQIPEAWRQYVFIHPTVPNNELLSRIAEHDIGLALESSNVISRDLTITNKLFQYLQAGLAVVATNTSGQQEIFSQFPDCGALIPCQDSKALADAINTFLLDSDRLKAAKSAALAAAQKLSWEQQSKKILDAVENAL